MHSQFHCTYFRGMARLSSLYVTCTNLGSPASLRLHVLPTKDIGHVESYQVTEPPRIIVG